MNKKVKKDQKSSKYNAELSKKDYNKLLLQLMTLCDYYEDIQGMKELKKDLSKVKKKFNHLF